MAILVSNPFSVPAAPLRRYLLGWQRTYNDDIETMAVGFDIDLMLILKLLGPSPARLLHHRDARSLCIDLRVDPNEIWEKPIAIRLGEVHWDTEALWPDAGVDPINLIR